MNIIQVQEYREIERDVKEFSKENLAKLVRGEISLLDYLTKSGELEIKLAEKSRIVTPDYLYFSNFFRLVFPLNSEEYLADLHSHSQIAVSYKLNPMFGIIMGCDAETSEDFETGIFCLYPGDEGKKIYAFSYLIDGSSVIPENFVLPKSGGAKKWRLDKFLKYQKEIANVDSRAGSRTGIEKELSRKAN